MRIRDYSQHTIVAYVGAVDRLANYYHESPDQLGREEIQAFLVELVEQKKVWPGHPLIAAAYNPLRWGALCNWSLLSAEC